MSFCPHKENDYFDITFWIETFRRWPSRCKTTEPNQDKIRSFRDTISKNHARLIFYGAITTDKTNLSFKSNRNTRTIATKPRPTGPESHNKGPLRPKSQGAGQAQGPMQNHKKPLPRTRSQLINIDHQLWTTISTWDKFDFELNFQPNPHFRNKCSILNSMFNPIHIFKQKLKQLLQHVSEQMFLVRTILDSGPASGSLLVGE